VLDRWSDNFFAETEQVAFCTQNVVPGIDFTNDPLLQGRNFSYLDTQLKRLGGPNFTHLPINAPKCPFAHFQQDGHMAMVNPVGRANYEPNGWGDGGRSPRGPRTGLHRPFEADEAAIRRACGPRVRRPLQPGPAVLPSARRRGAEHLADALVFELSKVETPAIRERMVASVVNVDAALAAQVAAGLGMPEVPPRLEPAVEPVDDLATSPALSIVANGPTSFEGRRVGALVTDGVDAVLLGALRSALDAEGAQLMVVAPTIEGVHDSEGEALAVDFTVDGGPSVLFDAVAVLPTEDGAVALASRPPAVQFVLDAHTHAKFVAWGDAAGVLFDAAGIGAERRDDGYVALGDGSSPADFVERCRSLRHWQREG
jgi:catalase